MSSTADETDIGTPLIILAWTLFSVAFSVVALRLWTRVGFLKDRLALHDYLMICAIISEVIHCVCLTEAWTWGLGRHIEALPGAHISKVGHWVVISESFSVLTSYFGRMSFSAFLLSVIGKVASPQRWILWGVIGINTFVNVLVIIQVYAQCGKDLSALWNPAVAAVAHCQAADVETYIGYFQAGTNSLCDLILTILPLTIVWKLQLPTQTKVALAALLCLSSFALVASIAKAVEIRLLSSGPDFTYHFAILQLVVVVENDVVIIAASMPLLRALWKEKDVNSGATNPYPSNSASRNVGSRKTTMNATAVGRDSGSDEEHILSELPKGAIHRTVETDVEAAYEDDAKEDTEVSVHPVGAWR